MNTRPDHSSTVTIPLSLYDALADWTRAMERFRALHTAYARTHATRGEVVVASNEASLAHERAYDELNAYERGYLGVTDEVTIATGLYDAMRRALLAAHAYRLAVAGGAAVDGEALASARSLALMTQLAASDLLRIATADECVVSR